MIFSKFNKIIPFKALLKLLIGFSLFIQLTVILYSHLSGYYTLTGVAHFMSKLLLGTLLTLLASVFLAYPNLFVIMRLDSRWSWTLATFRRTLIQFIATLFIAVVVSTAITLLSHAMGPYDEPLREVLINNALIFSVCNLILMIILEAWIFYVEKDWNRRHAEQIEQETAQMRFEVLKAQINPHFMFNSLNVLSGLIDTDHEKAQQFINEFSHIYRYILDTIDQYLVTAEDELRFSRSYIYLQQIRYGEHLLFSVDLPSHVLKLYLPPLSLQIILENVMKHNVISKDQPLRIRLFEEQGRLIVANNLQPKTGPIYTTGLGQKNLSRRFKMISDCEPVYRITENTYEAQLPLLTADADEYSDH